MTFHPDASRAGPAPLAAPSSSAGQTTDSLREREQRFRAVADNIPQLAWMTTASGEMLWFNRRWVEYTGLDLAAMQAGGWESVHHPDHPGAVSESWRRALESGEPWEHIFPLRSRTGEFRWFLSRALPIRDESGRITTWFGTNTDITEQREAQRELAEARDRLARHAADLERTVAERTARLTETVQELESFSYSLSHDMRAPLRAMRGFAQILEAEFGPQLGSAGELYLRRISMAAGRLDRLIQDVLTYSRMVQEKIELRPVQVERLVHQLMDENPALQRPHADIRLQTPLDEVLAHDACLMQLLSNLVYNAVKFVKPGQTPRVDIWTERRGARVRLHVRDAGIGIPHEVHHRLFGMFQRFHTRDGYEGTGIGLAIVRKAAERMGGAVGVESEVGEGSTFWVELEGARP